MASARVVASRMQPRTALPPPPAEVQARAQGAYLKSGIHRHETHPLATEAAQPPTLPPSGPQAGA